jgi:hypothetical protein
VSCGGLKLCTNITASADGSYLTNLLDVGFVHGGIMCCIGECWFFASVSRNRSDCSNQPILSVLDLIPALWLYLDAWKAWEYLYFQFLPLDILILSRHWILRVHLFIIRGLAGWEGVLGWKIAQSYVWYFELEMWIDVWGHQGSNMVVVTAGFRLDSSLKAVASKIRSEVHS